MKTAGGGGKEKKGEVGGREIEKKDGINDNVGAGEPPSKEKVDEISPSSHAINNNDDTDREKAAMATMMNGVKEQQPETNDQPAEEEEEELKHEMAFHQLESVLSEAKLIREASKNNAMSDEERRERAGETAMKIMGLLDGMGFDDDSEDGGPGSSSDEG
jgi:hypothetical protein